MDQEFKACFGKVLGEIYRLQRRQEAGLCRADDDTIYGLLNGLETAYFQVSGCWESIRGVHQEDGFEPIASRSQNF